MPTYAWLARFLADFDSLSPAQQAAFLTSVKDFVTDIARGGGFRKALRVKGVKGALGVFEMTGRQTDGPPSSTGNKSSRVNHTSSGVESEHTPSSISPDSPRGHGPVAGSPSHKERERTIERSFRNEAYHR